MVFSLDCDLYSCPSEYFYLPLFCGRNAGFAPRSSGSYTAEWSEILKLRSNDSNWPKPTENCRLPWRQSVRFRYTHPMALWCPWRQPRGDHIPVSLHQVLISHNWWGGYQILEQTFGTSLRRSATQSATCSNGQTCEFGQKGVVCVR